MKSYSLYFEPYVLTVSDREEELRHMVNTVYPKSTEVSQIMHAWLQAQQPNDLFIISHDPEAIYMQICGMFPSIEASGGLVLNSDKALLMIHRLGKWDLPKGKIDPGEHPGEAARREVMEETGIDKLHITKYLTYTRHIYQDTHKSWIIKHTAWYLMNTAYAGKLQPQEAENITQAVWVDKKGLPEKALHAYRSIGDLLRDYLIQTGEKNLTW